MLKPITNLDRILGKVFYDKDGHSLTFMEWSEKFADEKYRIIKQEKVGKLYISTVWLGMNLPPPPSFKAKLFESMVFKDGAGIESVHYTTKKEAKAGHKKLVAKYKKAR